MTSRTKMTKVRRVLSWWLILGPVIVWAPGVPSREYLLGVWALAGFALMFMAWMND